MQIRPESWLASAPARAHDSRTPGRVCTGELGGGAVGSLAHLAGLSLVVKNAAGQEEPLGALDLPPGVEVGQFDNVSNKN